MPNRIIKESICSSDNLDGLSWFEEVFFYRLIVNCDDYGRMDARPPILRAKLFPLKTVTFKQIEDALWSLRSANMIDLYEVDGHSYLQMRTWNKHQRIRAAVSKFPEPENGINQSAADSRCHLTADDSELLSNDRELLSNDRRNPIQSESESESNPSERDARARIPSEEEVVSYCQKQGIKSDPHRFYAYYQARGWMLRDRPVADWKALLKAWDTSGFKEKTDKGTFDTDEFFSAALAKSYGGSANGE